MTCDVTYDVLGNERHKAVCELRKLPDGYPSCSAFPFAKWYEDLSTALGICKGEVSCAKVRDTLIHLLGGDHVPVTLGDLYGISKEGDGGVDAGGRVETGGGRSDAAADGHMADSAGGQVSEGVAPITTGLRRYMEAYKPVEDGPSMVVSRIGTIGYAGLMEHCDSIDAIHAQLERDYKVACEVNERQDEQYADMVHKLDRAYEKNRNQRKQLTEVQEALHRRNEGELKARWQKEIDRLEHENEELRRQLDSLMPDSRPVTDENMAEHGWYRALDADKKPIHLGDKVYQVKGGWVYTVKSISFYPDNTTVTFECEHGFGSDNAHNVRHYHEPTVEDLLRQVIACANNGTHVHGALDTEQIVAEYAAKLRLASNEE